MNLPARILRRRCECCGASVQYVWKLIAGATFKNFRDADYPVELAAGALVCRRCVQHNEHERLANPQKPATTRKRCRRCGGAGKVRNPLQRGEARARTAPLHPITATLTKMATRAKFWKCTPCNGTGKVPAG